MTSCRQIMISLSFFQLMIDLEQSGTPIPNAWSMVSTFSLIATFYPTKIENRTNKESLTGLSYYYFEQRCDLCQKMLMFLQKIADISKIKKVLVQEGIFSKTTYLCVSSIILTSFRQCAVILPFPPPQNGPLKSPPRLEIIAFSSGSSGTLGCKPITLAELELGIVFKFLIF